MREIQKRIQFQIKRYNLENNVFFPLFCFFLMCCNEGPATRFVAMGMLILLFFRVFLGTGEWVANLALPFYLLASYVLWNGIRSFTAISTEFAFQDYTKLLVAFILLVFMLEQRKLPKHIAHIILVTSAIPSFLSIDLLGTRWFSSLFQVLISPFTEQYTILVGVEAGVRMVSIFSNPNIYAGFTGIAVLFGLGLVSNCQHKRKRIFLLLCLFCNALGFLLAFSLGATITLALAFLLYFLLESGRKKLSLLILMIETFFCALLSAFPIYLTSFQDWHTVNFYPLLSLTLGGIFYCFIHETVGKLVQVFLEEHEGFHVNYIKVIIIFSALFAIIGATWTSQAKIDQGESLRRAMYLEAGDYQLSMRSTALMEVSIHSQNQTDILRHTSTLLYQGSGNLIEFSVPDTAVVVFFTFSSTHDVVLEQALLTGGKKIPLNYVLFPEFLVHRLQGLPTNQNFWQRFVFFYDGFQLFLMNPIFGIGLGGFNSGLFRVQSFYYETKYAHNHYIQVLLESGIIGFFVFFGGIAFIIKRLWQGCRCQQHFTPVTLSVLLYTLCHGFMELTWSSGSFMIIAYLCLAICLLQCQSLREKTMSFHEYIPPILMVFSALYFVLISFQMTAEIMVNSSTDDESFQKNLISASKLDVFGRSGYMTSYVRAVANADDPKKLAQAEVYIRKIKAENSNVSAYYIAEYYFKQENFERALYYLEIYVQNGASHPEIWNSAFDLLHKYGWEIEEQFFLECNQRIYQLALDWDKNNMGSPVIDSEIREYVLNLLEEGS